MKQIYSFHAAYLLLNHNHKNCLLTVIISPLPFNFLYAYKSKQTKHSLIVPRSNCGKPTFHQNSKHTSRKSNRVLAQSIHQQNRVACNSQKQILIKWDRAVVGEQAFVFSIPLRSNALCIQLKFATRNDK